MTTTEIREALSAIEQTVDVPPVDQVAFQARVRSERRRRTAGRALVAAAAAAAVVTAGVVGSSVLDGPERVPTAETPGEVKVGSVPETVYFALDGKVAALDPYGQLSSSGLRSEGVVGWTDELVYAVSGDSHLIVFRVEDVGEGRLRFVEVESPVTGPVQRIVMSGDRRYLAWTDRDDVLHRYDLEAGREDWQLQLTVDDFLTAVGDEGVLLATQGGLTLRDPDSSLDLPVTGDGFPTSAQLAHGQVLVNDRDGRARLYDVRQGAAQPVTELPGAGTLGPFGERVAAIVADPEDRSHLEVWDGEPLDPPTGLDGINPLELRWADEQTLLVYGSRQGTLELYACDIELRCGRLPVDGTGSVQLNEW
ncbi:MAG TPA: hypothetical protein VFO49_03935 [Nocardioides sp.]|nr:hypothetical protein [Nocardioides sp.]